LNGCSKHREARRGAWGRNRPSAPPSAEAGQGIHTKVLRQFLSLLRREGENILVRNEAGRSTLCDPLCPAGCSARESRAPEINFIKSCNVQTDSWAQYCSISRYGVCCTKSQPRWRACYLLGERSPHHVRAHRHGKNVWTSYYQWINAPWSTYRPRYERRGVRCDRAGEARDGAGGMRCRSSRWRRERVTQSSGFGSALRDRPCGNGTQLCCRAHRARSG